jgi:hypothetical protein
MEYGSDFAAYFFGPGPRETARCGDLIVQWCEMDDGLYGVLLVGATTRLVVTSWPMRYEELQSLLRNNGCKPKHAGHDNMSGPAYAR